MAVLYVLSLIRMWLALPEFIVPHCLLEHEHAFKNFSINDFGHGHEQGIFYGSWRLLWVQPVGLIAVSAWTTAITLAYWLILRRFCRVRVPAEYEQVRAALCRHRCCQFYFYTNLVFVLSTLQQGLDVSFGMEPAYPEIYTMGDFVKFREFLETSWVASDARIAIDVFERYVHCLVVARAPCIGLPNQKKASSLWYAYVSFTSHLISCKIIIKTVMPGGEARRRCPTSTTAPICAR